MRLTPYRLIVRMKLTVRMELIVRTELPSSQLSIELQYGTGIVSGVITETSVSHRDVAPGGSHGVCHATPAGRHHHHLCGCR